MGCIVHGESKDGVWTYLESMKNSGQSPAKTYPPHVDDDMGRAPIRRSAAVTPSLLQVDPLELCNTNIWAVKKRLGAPKGGEPSTQFY